MISRHWTTPARTDRAAAARLAVDLQMDERVEPLQRLLVGDHIGRPLTMRIIRAGDLRDVEVVPVELES